MVVNMPTQIRRADSMQSKNTFDMKASSGNISHTALPSIPNISKSSSFEKTLSNIIAPFELTDMDLNAFQFSDYNFDPNMIMTPNQAYSPNMGAKENIPYAHAADMSLWQVPADSSSFVYNDSIPYSGLFAEGLQSCNEASPLADFWSPQSILNQSFIDSDLSGGQSLPTFQPSTDAHYGTSDPTEISTTQPNIDTSFSNGPVHSPVYVSPKDYNSVDCSNFPSMDSTAESFMDSSPLISLMDNPSEAYPLFLTQSLFDSAQPIIHDTTIIPSPTVDEPAEIHHNDSESFDPTEAKGFTLQASTPNQTTCSASLVASAPPNASTADSGMQNTSTTTIDISSDPGIACSATQSPCLVSQCCPSTAVQLEKDTCPSNGSKKRGIDRNKRRRGNSKQSHRSSDLSNAQLEALSRHIDKLLKTPKNADGLYYCPVCERSFVRRYNLKTHFAAAHVTTKLYSCQHCNWEFARKYDLQRHLRKKHDDLDGADLM